MKETELTKEQKKEIKKVVDRYLKMKFKRGFQKLTGIKLRYSLFF
jgi:hypothetical protein